jgi:cytochrome c oxidase subunit IV
MKKIYLYFCLLFVGSMLPFLIVEFYFQNYFTIGIIVILASVILTLCVFIEYLKESSIRKSDVQIKDLIDLNIALKKAETGKVASYFFRNRLH